MELTMIRDLETIALTEDLPEHGLKRGDLGTVVLIHAAGAMRSSS